MPFFLWRRFLFSDAVSSSFIYFLSLLPRNSALSSPTTFRSPQRSLEPSLATFNCLLFFYVFCIFLCFTFAHTDYFLHLSETRAGNYAYCCYLKFQTFFKLFALNRNGTKRRYHRDISINLPFMYMRYT